MARKFTKYPSNYIRASLYSTPKDATYLFNLRKVAPDTYNFMCQSVLLPNGTEKYLHNEVDVTFRLENGEPYILSGCHIGTQDFDFDEGDPWDDYVEHYHPGITEQVLNKIQKGDFRDEEEDSANMYLDRYIGKDVWVYVGLKGGLGITPAWIKILDEASTFQGNNKVWVYNADEILVKKDNMYQEHYRLDDCEIEVADIKVYKPITTHTSAELEQLLADNK